MKALILIIEKIPDAMECLLDTAVTVEKYDINNVKCEIKLDFGLVFTRITITVINSLIFNHVIYRAIVGYAETRGWSRYNNKNKPQKDRLHKPRKEMLLLTLILDASSASRKKILTHPLIAIFLYLKWRQVRIVFWATILCNVNLPENGIGICASCKVGLIFVWYTRYFFCYCTVCTYLTFILSVARTDRN